MPDNEIPVVVGPTPTDRDDILRAIAFLEAYLSDAGDDAVSALVSDLHGREERAAALVNALGLFVAAIASYSEDSATLVDLVLSHSRHENMRRG